MDNRNRRERACDRILIEGQRSGGLSGSLRDPAESFAGSARQASHRF